jgi:hypothetical protein
MCVSVKKMNENPSTFVSGDMDSALTRTPKALATPASAKVFNKSLRCMLLSSAEPG